MPCLDSGCARCEISFQDDVHHFELVNNMHLLKKLLYLEHLVDTTFLKENNIFFDHACNRQQPATEVVPAGGSTKIAVEDNANEESKLSLDGNGSLNRVQYTCWSRIDEKPRCESTVASFESNFLVENGKSNPYYDDVAQGGYIPNNYEEEMEECSEYTFSNQPYCPRTSESICSGFNVPATTDRAEVSDHDVCAELSDAVSAYNQVYGKDSGLERHSIHYQKHTNHRYHWTRNWLWVRNMQTQMTLTEEQSQHALRALLREACRREILRLRAEPVEKFINAPYPISSQGPMRPPTPIKTGFCTPAECKAFYIRQVLEKWHFLAKNINLELEKGTPTRSLLALVSAQSLFCSDLNHIVHELEPGLIEDSRQQRRTRSAQLLHELAQKGQLFVPPPTSGEGSQATTELPQPPSPTWSGCETPDDDTPALSSDEDGDYDDDHQDTHSG